MLGALAAFQYQLDGVARIGRQHGVDLALGIDKHHLAVDDIGLQFMAARDGRVGGGLGGGGGGGQHRCIERQQAQGGGDGAKGE